MNFIDEVLKRFFLVFVNFLIGTSLIEMINYMKPDKKLISRGDNSYSRAQFRLC
jgi:hypothetical protein